MLIRYSTQIIVILFLFLFIRNILLQEKKLVSITRIDSPDELAIRHCQVIQMEMGIKGASASFAGTEALGPTQFNELSKVQPLLSSPSHVN